MRQALLCCGGLICAPGYMKGQGRANSGAFVEIFSHNASFGHVFMYFYLIDLLLVFYGFQFCVFWYFHRCVSCVVPFFFLSPLFGFDVLQSILTAFVIIENVQV